MKILNKIEEGRLSRNSMNSIKGGVAGIGNQDENVVAVKGCENTRYTVCGGSERDVYYTKACVSYVHCPAAYASCLGESYRACQGQYDGTGR